MGFLAAAVVGAAAIGAGATAFAGSQQASAQEKAAQINAQNTQNTNQLNYEMFQQGRGSKGSSILPLYFTNANGTPFEGDTLAQNAMATYTDAYNAMPPDQQIAAAQSVLSQFTPMLQQANSTAQGIFNGDIENQQLQNEQGVAAARQQGVVAQKQAGLESLAQTLNDINNIQAGQGFTGDSFGSNLLKANASRSIATSAAANQANANLQTATEQSNIKQNAIQTRLNNLSLPSQMAQQNINFSNMPADAALSQEQQRQAVFNMFRIAPNQFTAAQMPTVQPIATTAQSIASGIGQFAGGMQQFATQKYLNNQNQNSNGSSSASNADNSVDAVSEPFEPEYDPSTVDEMPDSGAFAAD